MVLKYQSHINIVTTLKIGFLDVGCRFHWKLQIATIKQPITIPKVSNKHSITLNIETTSTHDQALHDIFATLCNTNNVFIYQRSILCDFISVQSRILYILKTKAYFFELL